MTTKLTRLARVRIVDAMFEGELGTITQTGFPFHSVKLDKFGVCGDPMPYRPSELERVDGKLYPAPEYSVLTGSALTC